MDQYRAKWHVQMVAILFFILEVESVKYEHGTHFFQIQHTNIRLKHLYAGPNPNLLPILLFTEKETRLLQEFAYNILKYIGTNAGFFMEIAFPPL